MIVRAMVLAAGFGTRLRPLTDHLPKPMVPVANRPLIAWCLDRLAAGPVGEVIVNLHHLGQALRDELGDGARFGLRIGYSPEEVILGTGGGLVRARPFFQERTFLVLNGDVLCAPDLSALLDFHRLKGAAATMLVRPLPAGADFTPLEVDSADRLVGLGGQRRAGRGPLRACMFCGVHVLEPAIFEHLPPSGFSCVVDQGYRGLLDAGLEVAACLYEGPWFDLGTPERYLEACGALLSGAARLPGFEPPAGGVLVDPAARVDPEARLGPEVCLGADCRVGAGARLERCLLWPGTRIAAGERLAGVIATPFGRLSA